MIRLVLHACALAALWCLLWGQADPWVFLAGLVIGVALVLLLRRVLGGEPPSTPPGRATPVTGVGAFFNRVGRLVLFGAYFVKILVKSNWVVAKVVLSGKWDQQPRIIRYSVEDMTDLQVTVLANAITLTPGTLSMDVSEDGKFLYVHCMSAADRDAAIKDLDELRDRILREVFG